MVSNACNAYDEISSKAPKFILNELLCPVTRDVLENGKGNKRRLSMKSQLSRAASIISLRMSYNSYPIYDVQQDRLRFRYMRHWIESSHKKMCWKVPTMLRIAMDVLDDTLDQGCCFHGSLERGDILICNNAAIVSELNFFLDLMLISPLCSHNTWKSNLKTLQAHGRDSFQDSPGKPRIHLVRAWMKMQQVDLLKPSNQLA